MLWKLWWGPIITYIIMKIKLWWTNLRAIFDQVCGWTECNIKHTHTHTHNFFFFCHPFQFWAQQKSLSKLKKIAILMHFPTLCTSEEVFFLWVLRYRMDRLYTQFQSRVGCNKCSDIYIYIYIYIYVYNTHTHTHSVFRVFQFVFISVPHCPTVNIYPSRGRPALPDVLL